MVSKFLRNIWGVDDAPQPRPAVAPSILYSAIETFARYNSVRFRKPDTIADAADIRSERSASHSMLSDVLGKEPRAATLFRPFAVCNTRGPVFTQQGPKFFISTNGYQREGLKNVDTAVGDINHHTGLAGELTTKPEFGGEVIEFSGHDAYVAADLFLQENLKPETDYAESDHNYVNFYNRSSFNQFANSLISGFELSPASNDDVVDGDRFITPDTVIRFPIPKDTTALNMFRFDLFRAGIETQIEVDTQNNIPYLVLRSTQAQALFLRKFTNFADSLRSTLIGMSDGVRTKGTGSDLVQALGHSDTARANEILTHLGLVIRLSEDASEFRRMTGVHARMAPRTKQVEPDTP